MNDLIVEKPTPEQVKALREKTGLSQGDFAKLIGVSNRQLIGDYENGNKTPNPQTWTMALLATGEHPNFKIKDKNMESLNQFEFFKLSPNARYDCLLELIKIQLADISENNIDKTIRAGIVSATIEMEVYSLNLLKNYKTYFATRVLNLEFSAENDEVADKWINKLDLQGYQDFYKAILALPQDKICDGMPNSDGKFLYYFELAKIANTKRILK